MTIGIFCSANDNIDRTYFDLTAELGRWCARQGHTIVFGGCNVGLMECVARAAKEAGGRTVGIIPMLVERHGRAFDDMDVHIPCDDLNDRKALMMARSDVFIALPGGIGTLDEVFTVAASASIGYHCKRVILYNMNGFWDSLIAVLNDLTNKGMIRGDIHRHICTADSSKRLPDCSNPEVKRADDRHRPPAF
uniref:LOG family protein n=1 Tax=Hoylesella pleuritidis TaxID=407975 RepID=UPI0004681B5B|nr:TIGR00730 family Rossman fold protein [Hoylesella pleuritidis]